MVLPPHLEQDQLVKNNVLSVVANHEQHEHHERANVESLTPSFKNEVVDCQGRLGRRLGQLPFGKWHGERCCGGHHKKKTKAVTEDNTENSGRVLNIDQDCIGIWYVN